MSRLAIQLLIRQSKDIIIGATTEPIAAWMHLRTARAECGRNSFKKRENIIEDHENLNLTCDGRKQTKQIFAERPSASPSHDVKLST